MSYRHLGDSPAPETTDQICFPKDAIMRLQPRAAGPIRSLMTLTGGFSEMPISPNRGLLIVDPRYDNLPLGPGWEWRT